ncbi:helicase-exonuclease AddAB subunit AddA [Alicyclobacillus herbarius]|uniref:helicase-exonuclease AddAB subunit AddA n=1 Tax=Alicyclobacillus herbarius TaxID=122960 RepID=UPI00041F57C5|nr:helicase-exonuclease AddAB subunit AddA [Alicyclobacillus herbarius]
MAFRNDRWSDSQLRAIETVGHNLLVSAGAGSGKTSVLVERVVRRIAGEHAVDLDRLLIVTFTEAAAAEMRNRIALRLQELLAKARQERDKGAVRRLSRQLLLLDQAQISTLHSFCMEVVRRNFLFLGIEPTFRILSEEESALLRREQFERLLESRLARDEAGAFADTLVRFQAANPLRLAELVFRMDTFSRSQPDPAAWLDQVQASYAEAEAVGFSGLAWTPVFLEWLAEELAYAEKLCTTALNLAGGADELAQYTDNLTAVRQALREWRGQLEAQGLDASLPTAQALQGLLNASVRGKNHPCKEEVKALRDEAKKVLQKVIAIAGRGEASLLADIRELAPHVQALVEFIREFQTLYETAKRRRQALDFTDLEHLALRVLQDPESGERHRLQHQFVEVFVDEYQDTSPIQDTLVSAIARPEGNLFVVGDVKQSIYRFRMAEPGLFLHRYHTMGRTEPGEVIELTANYRSRVEVVDAVNFFFMQWFVPALGGIAYTEETWMVAGAKYPKAEESVHTLAGPVEVHLVERMNDEQGKADNDSASEDGWTPEGSDSPDALGDAEVSIEDLNALELEGTVIAQRILELMGQVDGHPAHQVWDAGLKQYRPLQYRDIVILLRSARGRTNTLLDVLARHKIPAYGATSTGFYGALEVRWLTSALAAIDNPRREVALAALLRSPLVGLNDVELAQIRLFASGNYYDALRQAVRAAESGEAGKETEGDQPVLSKELAERLRRFWRRFSAWRQAARQDPVEVVLRKVLADTHLMAFLLAMPGGEIRRANVELLLDKAREFDNSTRDGVFGFVRRLGDIVSHQMDTGEAQAIAAGEDVVRVMTIHQSKGLEFPVVFVADLGKSFYQDPQEKAYPLHPELGVGPQFVDGSGRRRWVTMPSVALAEINRREFLAEEARVLYVALTRARERLILVASMKNVEERLRRALQGVPSEGRALPSFWLMRARGYVDWLLPALLRHQDGSGLRQAVQTDAAHTGVLHPLAGVYDHPARFHVQLWNASLPGAKPIPLIGWQPAETEESGQWVDFSAFCAWLKQNTEDATESMVSAALLGATDRPLWTDVPGKVSATDLRRLWVARRPAQGKAKPGRLSLAAAENLLETPQFIDGKASPRASGSAYHAVMQHIDFTVPSTRTAVEAALDELCRLGRISAEERETVVVDDVLAFLQSDLGQRAARAKRVWREQPFFARLELAHPETDAVRIDKANPGTETNRFVVVQGVIDLMFEEEDGFVLVDYKTDKVQAGKVTEHAAEYAAQVAAYLRVVEAAVRPRPVSAWLYFVRARAVVPMSAVDLSSVFTDQ